MRVVVDANVLVSGIFWTGLPHRVLLLWAHDRFELIASRQILVEYEDIIKELGRNKRRMELALSWTSFLVQHATLINVHSQVQLCRDPDDNKYLDCAFDGGADVIVSGDRDLLDLQADFNIPILAPKQFLARFQ